MEVEVRGGQQGLEDADEAEGRAAVGDEVDLISVGTEEGRDLLQRFRPGNKKTSLFRYKNTVWDHVCFLFMFTESLQSDSSFTKFNIQIYIAHDFFVKEIVYEETQTLSKKKTDFQRKENISVIEKEDKHITFCRRRLRMLEANREDLRGEI